MQSIVYVPQDTYIDVHRNHIALQKIITKAGYHIRDIKVCTVIIGDYTIRRLVSISGTLDISITLAIEKPLSPINGWPSSSRN